MSNELIHAGIAAHQATIAWVEAHLVNVIGGTAERMADCVGAGHKVLFCGNGGSASDAQHLATELVGRFEAERPGMAAISLNSDTSLLTALGNDYGFDRVFARQVQALARPGDLLFAISTSGNSPNVIEAVREARVIGVHTIGLLGRSGGRLRDSVDTAIIVPGERTARIQEAHILIGHLICAAVDHLRGVA